MSELPGGRLRLSFEPVAPDPALEQFRVEEARAVLTAFRDTFSHGEKPRLRLVKVSTGGEQVPAEWERRLREQFVSRYGPPPRALLGSLAESPLVMALRLSPRYMGTGVREAAGELFSSPVFLASVALSVAVYFSAWLLPEPVFSKAFVAAWTLRLTLAVGALELTHVALTCLRLYQEAEAARTVAELEAAAERFGRAMGGTGLRVLVLVASMGVARELPQVPEGGLGALLRAPRYELGEELMMGGSTTVQMVADGTVVVTGAVAGTAAAALGSACGDGSTKKDDHQWHHLATDKNETSTANGGPWTLIFKALFAQAGMRLDAAENLVYLQGHKGPHPEEYHREVYRRLTTALGRCQSVEPCRRNLVRELKILAEEICTPGTLLHGLATKK